MNFSFTGGAGIQDRITAPDDPGGFGQRGAEEAALEFAYWQAGLLGAYKEQFDTIVSTQRAMHYSAVWACVRWISQTIAAMPWYVYERADRGRNPVEFADNIAWIIGMQPNSEVTAFDWKQVMLNHALTDGNGYSEIVRDGFGRIREVDQIGRGRCAPDRLDDGRLVYEVTNGSGIKNTVLDPSQVFHLKGLGDDGIVGYSVIEMARRSISVGINEEKFSDDFFCRGPTPGGIFTTKAKLPAQQEKEARESFDRLYSGRRNVGRVIRLTGDATFTPLSLPNRDAQLLESRKFSVEEICRWFGVPPHKIQHLERSTNNNIEHQAIEAVQDCLLPWARRLESEADVKFFGRVAQGKRFTEFDFGRLLRGDMVSQSDALSKQVTGCMRTPNEAREELGLNPDPDGDTLLVQGAMIPLGRAIEPPVPPPAPTPPTQDGSPPPAGAGDVTAAFERLLTDAYGRLLRVESDKAKRAANKGKLYEHCDAYYGAECQSHVADTLTPIFAAFLAASGRNSIAPSQLATAAAERHVIWSKQILTTAGAVPDDWGARAAELATAELKLAWENSK